MKLPFFSRSKKAEAHLASESSNAVSSSLSSSSSSMPSSSRSSRSGSSGSGSGRERRQHKKSGSFSGPLEKLRKSSSFSGLARQGSGSGRLFGFKSMRPRSGSLPVQHSRELTETFKYFDKNGDGKISALELGEVLRSLGIASTHEELEAMVRDVDCDNDGFIDLAEFITLNNRTRDAADGDADEDRTMEAAFEVFDINKDGFISATELHRVLSDLGEVLTEEDCHVMIRNVDRNGDMLVDFSEFKHLMQDTRVF